MMTSGVLSYQLGQFNDILRHGRKTETLVRDSEDTPTKINVDVQVRSGDYFVTLATVLDRLAVNLPYATRAQLEDIVSDLIYLQDTHKITKNNVG
jgi:hypothetical protein